MDHATSTSPAVQAQLDRLTMLSPGADVLGLGRIRALLDRLGNPEARLPPVFHVAGTNGKGSTCAFLRAALEAEGYCVHAYTSPHLVRFNERIRVAGTLITDDDLAPLLARVLDVADGIGASFFEVTTAVAFVAFAETPADACVIEVGLGGRLDATNVIDDPAACGIAQLGIDHQAFLGDTLAAIAREKAGIAKRGRPLVTLDYGASINDVVRGAATEAGADLLVEVRAWRFGVDATRRQIVHDWPAGAATITTPWPLLPGDHQVMNLALAIAMLRSQDHITVSTAAFKAAAASARWPARMQRLADGPLMRRLPADTPVWLDGGHNEPAAHAVAEALRTMAAGAKVDLVVGMLANKDATGFLAPILPLARSLTGVPIPGHDHHPPEALAEIARSAGIPARTAADMPAAFDRLAQASTQAVAVLGSLYLAGDVLGRNDELPD
ncbi:bifunctional folylpolyglutamate synthase/dihydrofolate synthase [Sphingomonas sp. Leaf33]|uniref:bifunctional folylpolyglutamate synthase/dihydrofolate synthase n=1 Tax=Sphingomonas sp. Leaf33 TaxID=1736215 RepID=UPI0006F6648B|nr:folylpolyglutamate synthase/dihydrofolate synthase family protein [Sphingomonas sp. Leaf33]KQN26195.1 bifunctional folylpolyglutamate synthase/dihydrofolate synthase [Sphingomonas sp. Leaf33]